MTKQEILNAFLQAEKEFEKSNWNCLCGYFEICQGVPFYKIVFLRDYWVKHRLRYNSAFHFYNHKERLQAIKNVIKDLKNELGITH